MYIVDIMKVFTERLQQFILKNVVNIFLFFFFSWLLTDFSDLWSVDGDFDLIQNPLCKNLLICHQNETRILNQTLSNVQIS